MKKIIAFICLFATLVPGLANARSNTQDQVHLFQTFFEDASMVKTTYGQASLRFSDFDFASTIEIPVQINIPTGRYYHLNFGIETGFISVSPEVGDGQSGLADLKFVGRYNFPTGKTKVAAGGYITLPIGNEDVGQGNLNIGGFGALRYPISAEFTLTGALMLEFIEQPGFRSNRESSLLFAAGCIYEVDPRLHVIGEINLKTGVDYGLLSVGVDYVVTREGSFRGVLGLGLDDFAPDVSLQVGYHHYFN
jgi:hypothetical protein